eukprot:TRINITY_DN2205_c0_g1_i1.p1 TRINITY_DN2205_c0_g1~~TRINITY_DN2205_c0_g1_i1.p1  ORF type:complete len:656 (+),score=118.56 TRINITY_DN2205_c0_g1_i1:36-2003(+)
MRLMYFIIVWLIIQSTGQLVSIGLEDIGLLGCESITHTSDYLIAGCLNEIVVLDHSLQVLSRINFTGNVKVAVHPDESNITIYAIDSISLHAVQYSVTGEHVSTVVDSNGWELFDIEYSTKNRLLAAYGANLNFDMKWYNESMISMEVTSEPTGTFIMATLCDDYILVVLPLGKVYAINYIIDTAFQLSSDYGAVVDIISFTVNFALILNQDGQILLLDIASNEATVEYTLPDSLIINPLQNNHLTYVPSTGIISLITGNNITEFNWIEGQIRYNNSYTYSTPNAVIPTLFYAFDVDSSLLYSVLIGPVLFLGDQEAWENSIGFNISDILDTNVDDGILTSQTLVGVIDFENDIEIGNADIDIAEGSVITFMGSTSIESGSITGSNVVVRFEGNVILNGASQVQFSDSNVTFILDVDVENGSSLELSDCEIATTHQNMRINSGSELLLLRTEFLIGGSLTIGSGTSKRSLGDNSTNSAVIMRSGSDITVGGCIDIEDDSELVVEDNASIETTSSTCGLSGRFSSIKPFNENDCIESEEYNDKTLSVTMKTSGCQDNSLQLYLAIFVPVFLALVLVVMMVSYKMQKNNRQRILDSLKVNIDNHRESSSSSDEYERQGNDLENNEQLSNIESHSTTGSLYSIELGSSETTKDHEQEI